MRSFIVIAAIVCLPACVERRPFPESRFKEIAKRCGYQAVTYTARKSFWKEEPLIDFSREKNPQAAMACFHEADLAISKENINEADLGVAFIWETRS